MSNQKNITLAAVALTQGKVAIVDVEDYNRVTQYTWHAHKNRNKWYARTLGEKS